MKNYGYKRVTKGFADIYIAYKKNCATIIFDLEDELVNKKISEGLIFLGITMQELKAINEKVKELGWEE